MKKMQLSLLLSIKRTGFQSDCDNLQVCTNPGLRLLDLEKVASVVKKFALNYISFKF